MASKNNFDNKAGKKQPTKKKKRAIRALVCFALIALICGGVVLTMPHQNKIDEKLGFRKVETFQKGDLVVEGSLNIHFIDVGQGDACLIELPDDRTMLIDAGDKDKKVAEKIINYIDEVNKDRAQFATPRPEIKFFDYVIATHADSDHIGSMDKVLKEYPAATFYRPNEEAVDTADTSYADPAYDAGNDARHTFWGTRGIKNSGEYRDALAEGYKNHPNFKEAIVTNPHDDTQNVIKPNLDISDPAYYEINFYGPIQSKYTGSNNHSPIMIIEYKNRRIALSGDSEKLGERDFANAVNSGLNDRYVKLQGGFYADIINLGHHGSDTSTTDEYLAVMTNPSFISEIYVTISCDDGRAHGHPDKEVLDRLIALGIKEENILATDEVGDIFFALNFYEGKTNAFVEQDSAGILTEITYPTEILGIKISYKIIAPIIAAVLCLILLLIAVGGNKKKFLKETKKLYKNNKKR